MTRKSTLLHRGGREKYLYAFLLGFACIFICLLPVIIADGGYFIYYGDYNAQQIPFYILANNAVKNGFGGWNWFTDLGSDFLTSYSFYLSGSPFFLLSSLLPAKAAVLCMPLLLSLKHGLAAVTAYGYIRRFVRNKDAALIGGLLYSFSGFQIYNIFFNHFHDVTSFFPLMLISMEELVNRDRKGVFALTTALMSVINYFFFTGQAVFLVIYFIIRVPCSDFHITAKKFVCLLIEAILGTMIGAFILIPSAMTIIGNYRVSEFLYGQNMVLYSDKTRIPRIIQTFFMPSDSPARPNLFNSDYGKWASIGGYLPLFSMVGVITFMRGNKRHWAVKLSAVCIICAFIPVLNSAFYAFNASYYARWFYMPILIFAMMTARTLDDEDSKPLPAIKICAAVLAAFCIIALLPTKNNDGKTEFFKLPRDIAYFGVTMAIAASCLIGCTFVFYRKRKGLSFMNLSVLLTAAACTACTFSAIIYGAATPSSAKTYVKSAINGADGVYETVSEDNFFRVDTSEDYDNYPMCWGLPTMRAFQSVVSTSIMEFYDSIGIQRDVASRADTNHYTLRGLFSVKYYYNRKSDDETEFDKNNLPGFSKVGSNDYFDIYQNDYFVNMGFPYEFCVSDEKLAEKGDTVRERALMKALVLTDSQIKKYSDIIDEVKLSDISSLGKNDYLALCTEKRQTCSDSFSFDSHGFTSEINLSEPRLVFFSVPYSEGWTAEVNGKPADVEKVSYGFMAVRADAGVNEIVFRYETPGLKAGIIISITGIAGLALYLLICRRKKNRSETVQHCRCYDYESMDKIGFSDEYCDKITHRNYRK